MLAGFCGCVVKFGSLLRGGSTAGGEMVISFYWMIDRMWKGHFLFGLAMPLFVDAGLL